MYTYILLWSLIYHLVNTIDQSPGHNTSV